MVTTDVEKAEPKPPLVGTVIASGAFDITPVPLPTIDDPDFLMARRLEGNFAANLAPTAGKLLVLSLREVLDALECPTFVLITECATMVVLEQDGPEPGRRPGRLTVSLPDPVTFYPSASFDLGREAESI